MSRMLDLSVFLSVVFVLYLIPGIAKLVRDIKGGYNDRPKELQS